MAMYSSMTEDRREDYPVCPLDAIFKPFCPDLDGGPIRAWVWCYQGLNGTLEPGRLVNVLSRRPCRRLMLVMWDEQRLNKIRFMNSWDVGCRDWLQARHSSNAEAAVVWDSGITPSMVQATQEEMNGRSRLVIDRGLIVRVRY